MTNTNVRFKVRHENFYNASETFCDSIAQAIESMKEYKQKTGYPSYGFISLVYGKKEINLGYITSRFMYIYPMQSNVDQTKFILKECVFTAQEIYDGFVESGYIAS